MRGQKEFKFLFRNGRRIERPIFRVVFIKNKLGYPRYALIAPKTASKLATTRNRLRRRAKEWIRRNPQVNLAPYDLAIVFKKEAASASKNRFYEELKKAFEQING